MSNTPVNISVYIDALTTILQQLAPGWFKTNAAINLSNIVAFVASVVEKFAFDKNFLASDDKLNVVIQFLPIAIQRLNSLGFLTNGQAAALTTLVQDASTVEGIVTTLINIANNPNLLQAATWVKAKGTCC